MYAKQRPIFEQKTASNSVITPVVNNNEVPSINSHSFLLSHIGVKSFLKEHTHISYFCIFTR